MTEDDERLEDTTLRAVGPAVPEVIDATGLFPADLLAGDDKIVFRKAL